MGDGNFNTLVGAFNASSETVALACRVKVVYNFTDGFSNEILWQFGPVFGPISFHNAQLGLIRGEHKAIVFPEFTEWFPN